MQPQLQTADGSTVATNWQNRLETVLRSWEGTPWAAGQCCPGRGVDCRYFVCGVLDELYQIRSPLPPRKPLDTAIHNRDGAVTALRQLIDRYPSETIPVDSAFEPGDVLIVRPPLAHDQTLKHAIIIGPGGRAWHAGRGGVSYIAIAGWAVTHAFRPLEKQRWI